jgi:hypothetical protein
LDPDKPTLQKLAGKQPEPADPIKFEFVSALLCERILREADGIVSAIRIVDIFQVPENPPENFSVKFFAFVTLKTVPVPESASVVLGATLIKPDGTRSPITPADREPVTIKQFRDDPSVPGGVSLVVEVNVKPQTMGTSVLEIDVDGVPVTRVPFTLLRVSSAAEIQ